MKKILVFFVTFILVISHPIYASANGGTNTNINDDVISEKRAQIDNLVGEIMRESEVPGISIGIVLGEENVCLSYGYSNVEKKVVASSQTLYEIGSMSKSFTAMGILLLEDNKRLSLDDPVSKYIPWFRTHYKGIYDGTKYDGDVEISLRNLLNHTSGIPFETIGFIPEGKSNDSLESTIRNINGIDLCYYPGDRYQYATINYDILGYIIQVVSGVSYETFMTENIILPLGLEHTYFFHDDAKTKGDLAQGYKMEFFRPIPYNAPIYRGNTPAGYIISNVEDMMRWMRIQMGDISVSEQFERIIDRSHVGDTSVASYGEYYYSAGWRINIKGRDINHGGNNPNYSSMLIMDPENGVGICVLSNMNSNASSYIANAILNIIQEKEMGKYVEDSYKQLDTVFSITIITSSVLGLLYFILICKSTIEIYKKRRIKNRLNGVKVAGLFISVPFAVFLGYCIYYLPNVMLERLPWKAVNVWGSSSIMYGSIAAYISILIFLIYVILTFNFPLKHEKGYMTLIPLSLINGIGSALIIFTINESFNRNLEYSKELLVYFIFALLLFIYTIKVLQGRMIIITNELAYEKRIEIIDRIMHSSYQSIENIGRDRIFTSLNNDCTALAQIPSLIIGFASNLLTLIFCLWYIASKSLMTFFASLGIVILNGLICYVTSRLSAKYWEENRDIQDTYFNQIHDLVDGFKELVLNKLRRVAFWQEIKVYARKSTELNKTASIKFLNYGLYNTLMYNIVFGIVVFAFPILIPDIDVNQLRENLFIVFYLIGPFSAVVGVIPQVTQININIKRIDQLITALNSDMIDNVENFNDSNELDINDINIKFNDVTYAYHSSNKENHTKDVDFVLGPINMEIRSNQITFITGGNGSGKSTLGKLITGLYPVQEGTVYVNGNVAKIKDLNELFSSVYSDYNLFKKLYGIDYDLKREEIDELLDVMKIREKVDINEKGEFKTIELSTGQRKRLAFIVCCLEDKPMLIFDEWAAEQDPEFREYFYEHLLPMLKNKGKGVVVISHDDRYFHIADQLIKLERGLLVEH